jgi:hypothetical protein
VLDNASRDGSAEAVRERGGDIRLIALERRAGKAENDSTLLREARGRYCLLLNEDSELRPGAAAALLAALDADPAAAAAGARLLDSSGRPVPCAWRFPGVGTALAGALFLHRLLTVQSRGDHPGGRLGPVQRSAGPPRGGWRGRLPRPGLLRLLRRVRPLQAARRCRLAHPLRPQRRGDPPRPALHRPRRRPAADRRVPPQPRPLHAQAPFPPRGPGRPPAHRLVLRAARSGRDLSPQPAGKDLLGPRPTSSLPQPRRKPARSRGTGRCREPIPVGVGTSCTFLDGEARTARPDVQKKLSGDPCRDGLSTSASPHRGSPPRKPPAPSRRSRRVRGRSRAR